MIKPDFEKTIKEQYSDSLSLLELIWKEAYNQAVDDCVASAKQKYIQIDDGFMGTKSHQIVDLDSILKNKII